MLVFANITIKSIITFSCMCVRVFAGCVYVCVKERNRDRDRERKKRGKGGDGKCGNG